MRKALAITHVAFEGLGSLAPELTRFGFAIETIDACTADLRAIDPLAPDLVVALGGPIGVYERDAYPFLDAEIDLIRARLAARRPTLGLCLGAQLMAAALGSRVYPGAHGKRIGWAPIEAGGDLDRCPWFARLFAPGLNVLHWHGDTFDMPEQALHLAATRAYPSQAFAIGAHALALQFHIEATALDLERWYVGHACELAYAGLDIRRLREEGRNFAPALETASKPIWQNWLSQAIGAWNVALTESGEELKRS